MGFRDMKWLAVGGRWFVVMGGCNAMRLQERLQVNMKDGSQNTEWVA